VTRSHDEQGLAAPVVVVLAGLLVVLTVVGASLGRLLVDQRRVSAAADLAALAGASAMQRAGDGCEEAGAVAAANGARLLTCVVSGQRVRVEAGLASPTLLRRVVQLHASGYAGPTG
jgi:secretion/DNA translocation related TadE-like protein